MADLVLCHFGVGLAQRCEALGRDAGGLIDLVGTARVFDGKLRRLHLLGRIDGVDEKGGEGDDDPRPWTQGVVRGIEEERAKERVAFRLGREHALRDVAATAWLGAGIPDRPPLDQQWHEKNAEQGFLLTEVGNEIQETACAFRRGEIGNLVRQSGKSADLRLSEDKIGQRESPGHGDAKLDQVDDQDPPEPGACRKNDIHHTADDERFLGRPSECHGGDLHCSKVDRCHDETIEE